MSTSTTKINWLNWTVRCGLHSIISMWKCSKFNCSVRCTHIKVDKMSWTKKATTITATKKKKRKTKKKWARNNKSSIVIFNCLHQCRIFKHATAHSWVNINIKCRMVIKCNECYRHRKTIQHWKLHKHLIRTGKYTWCIDIEGIEC